MAFQMPFQDASGRDVPTSHWTIVQMDIGIADRTAKVLFYAYADAGKAGAGKQPIGQKSYSISGAEFDAWFTPIKNAVTNKGIALAKSVLDSGANGTKSFFDGATEV